MPASLDNFMLDKVFFPLIKKMHARVSPLEFAMYTRAVALMLMLVSLAQAPDRLSVMIPSVAALIALLASHWRFIQIACWPDQIASLRIDDLWRRVLGMSISVVLFALLLLGYAWDGLGAFLTASILYTVSCWLAVCQNVPPGLGPDVPSTSGPCGEHV